MASGFRERIDRRPVSDEADPFADLARIIGFDLGEKADDGAAALANAPRVEQSPAPEQDEDFSSSLVGAQQQRTENDWETELSDLDFVLNESMRSVEDAPDALPAVPTSTAASGDDELTFDDDAWEDAITASLGEEEQHSAPVAHDLSDVSSDDLALYASLTALDAEPNSVDEEPTAAFNTPIAGLRDEQSSADQFLDEPLSLELEAWDLEDEDQPLATDAVEELSSGSAFAREAGIPDEPAGVAVQGAHSGEWQNELDVEGEASSPKLSPSSHEDDALDDALSLGLDAWAFDDEDREGAREPVEARNDQVFVPSQPVEARTSDAAPEDQEGDGLGSLEDDEFELDDLLAQSIEQELVDAWDDEELAPSAVERGGREASARDEAVASEDGAQAAADWSLRPAAALPASRAFEDELAALLGDEETGGVGVSPHPVAAPDYPAAGNHETTHQIADASFEEIEEQVARVDHPAVTGASSEASAERTVPPAHLAPAEPTRRAEAPAPSKAAAAPPEDDDPFAALAAMAARYRAGRSSVTPAAPAAAPSNIHESPRAPETNENKGPEPAMRNTMTPRAAAPEIETVHVPDYARAMPDDLNIPDMPFEERRAGEAGFDDLDTEFADLLNEMSDGRRGASAAAATARRSEWDEPRFAPQRPVRNDAAGPQYQAYTGADDEIEDNWNVDASGQHAGYDEAGNYDERFDDEMSDDQAPEKRRSVLRKPGTWLAVLIGTVTLAGGAGLYAMGGGSMGDGTPALVKADASPLKVRPTNPGGVVVPNQDSTVYDRVAGGSLNEAEQPKLLANTEEPVDLAAATEDDPVTEGLDFVGGDPDVDEVAEGEGKSEDRVAAQAPDEEAGTEEGIAVAPRKVRTMIVKADGTLVPREDAAVEPEEPVAAVAPAVNAARDALKKTQEGSMARSAAAADQTASIAPASADDMPAEPADATVQTASISPGEWSIQVASQPNEAAAKASYDNLVRKYSGVLDGRGVNIVKAEIAGKGTFWRVRVPAGSRDDAARLCTNLKAAGGTCFVSK